MFICRICGMHFAPHLNLVFESHISRCVRRNEDVIDHFRPLGAPFEGDPELAAFARAEGDVYNRRPGTRRRPR